MGEETHTPTESKVGESHRSGAHRKNGEKRGAAGEPSRSGWSAPAGRRPDGVPPLVSSAGAALGPQLHEPRAKTKRGGGRRLKRGGGRSGDVS